MKNKLRTLFAKIKFRKQPKAAGEDSWNMLQIMSELVQGQQQLSQLEPTVSIFGSARFAEDHQYYRMANRIAYLLSQAGFSVVTGGGGGVMEAANKGGAAGKSVTVGLNMLELEQANKYQNLSLYFKHFFSRKMMFVKYASAFIFFPGGFGTLDELASMLILLQCNKCRKIPLILIGDWYWQGLLKWFKEYLLAEKMIDAADLELMQIADDPEQILPSIFSFYQSRGIEMTEEERQIMSGL